MLRMSYGECLHSPLLVMGLEKEKALRKIEKLTSNCSLLMMLLTPYYVQPSYQSELIDEIKRIGRSRRLRLEYLYKNLNQLDKIERRYALCYPLADLAEYLLFVRRVVNWWRYVEPSLCEGDICLVNKRTGGTRRILCPSDAEAEDLLEMRLVTADKETKQKLGFASAELLGLGKD